MRAPMLATRGDHVPSGTDWVHEVKWDGVRIIAVLGADGARLFSRAGNDVTGGYPEVVAALQWALLGRQATLDGEVVVFVDGRPSFAALAERMHQRNLRRVAEIATATPATFLIFDLLDLDGRDLTGLRWRERRAQLESLQLGDDRLITPPTYDDGEMLLAATAQQELEGIVSKRVDSSYRPGQRSREWLKFPHRTRRSVVVGGWRPETGSSRLGAVLVGEPSPQGLVFRGRVGSGLGGKLGRVLEQALSGSERHHSPFCNDIPAVDARGATWVEPRVIVDVESLGLSSQQRLRQPAVKSIRSDLHPSDLGWSDRGDGDE